MMEFDRCIKLLISLILPVALITISCCRSDHLPSLSTGGTDYVLVNLVSDTAGLSAARVDTNLANPWGIAISPKGSIWISCNHSAKTVVYNATGQQTLAPVAIPFGGVRYGASPDGVVYNSTSDFAVNGKPAKFIYANEEGTLSGWVSGDSTITVADRSATGALYKGITIANDGAGNFIYAADFLNAKIDVFDRSFNYISGKQFADTSIPAGFAPFNVRNINGKLFVAFAKQKRPDKHDDERGPGNGYIDVFNTNGILIKRFVTGGSLNSPWGMATAPVGFGQMQGAILIANFGDGRINVFDSTGRFVGPLEINGIPVVINGIWDIVFNPANNSQLFFTAGPNEERNGLFGYLLPR